MSAEKMRLFSEMIFAVISKMEDNETEKAGREQTLEIIKDYLQKAYTGRNITVEEAEPFLKKVEQYYAAGKLTAAKRNEYFQARENDLIPFDQRIHEYKEAITKFEARIHLLGEMIQEAGEKIQILMAQHTAEAAQLKPETAKYIFSYTRFNPSLFRAPPLPNTTKHSPGLEEIKRELEQQTRAYFTAYNRQSKGC